MNKAVNGLLLAHTVERAQPQLEVIKLLNSLVLPGLPECPVGAIIFGAEAFEFTALIDEKARLYIPVPGCRNLVGSTSCARSLKACSRPPSSASLLHRTTTFNTSTSNWRSHKLKYRDTLCALSDGRSSGGLCVRAGRQKAAWSVWRRRHEISTSGRSPNPAGQQEDGLPPPFRLARRGADETKTG